MKTPNGDVQLALKSCKGDNGYKTPTRYTHINDLRALKKEHVENLTSIKEEAKTFDEDGSSTLN